MTPPRESRDVQAIRRVVIARREAGQRFADPFSVMETATNRILDHRSGWSLLRVLREMEREAQRER